MLTRFDDYPIHQTPEPIAQPASADRNVYDRYWFNGYAEDGEFYFGIGAALYPNLQIFDCGFSIVRGGEQHAFHASRRASGEPSDLAVGPFRIEIVEPMRRLRVVLDDNRTGIACDLLFEARSACIEEGRQTIRTGGKLLMDSTRFAQFGRWRGEIRYAGTTLRIDPQRVHGTKDRSWGVRPVGDPDPGGAPATVLPQFFFLWSPIHWRDRCSHFGIFEHADGRVWHFDGAIVPAYASPDEIPAVEEPRIVHMARGEHRLHYLPGTRRADAATITLVEPGGRRHTIALEPLCCFYMKGIGYTHPEWGHGRWKGELAIAGESWRTADLDPKAIDNQHVQQVVRARCEGETGVGVLEQFAIGPYAPYGLTGLFDPA